MKILHPPTVLALHLKRFKWDEHVQAYVKLSSRVVFPLELRLFNTSDHADDPDRLYELCGIVVHSGEGSSQGHYVSIVRVGSRWALFDDDTVEFIPEADLSKFYEDSTDSGSAYVLLYQAKGDRAPETSPTQTTSPTQVAAPAPLMLNSMLPPVSDPPTHELMPSVPLRSGTSAQRNARPMSMPPEAFSQLRMSDPRSRQGVSVPSVPSPAQSPPPMSAASRMVDWLPRRSSGAQGSTNSSSKAATPATSPTLSQASSNESPKLNDTPRVPKEEPHPRKFSLGRSALSRTLRFSREK